MLGNPTLNQQLALPKTTQPNNYLLEKPQYAVSYNNDTKNPNWVSWVLNEDWLGPTGESTRLRNILRTSDFPANYPPDTDYYTRRPDDPWISDTDLTSSVFTRKVEGADFNNAVSTGGIQRGHMTAFGNRTRSVKDAMSTYLTTNLVPQYSDNNGFGTSWFNFEQYIENTLIRKEKKEVHLMAGTYFDSGSSERYLLNRAVNLNGEFIRVVRDANNTYARSDDGRLIAPNPSEFSNLKRDNIIEQDANLADVLKTIRNSKNIRIPDFTWKIAVVLEPGQKLSEITANTQVIAIITPNIRKPDNNSSNWGFWPDRRVSVNDLERITGYNFLHNLSDDIEEIIENDDSSVLLLPLEANLSAPLLASPVNDFQETTDLNNNLNLAKIFAGVDSTIRHDSLKSVADWYSVSSSLEVGTSQISFTQVTVPKISLSEVSVSELGIGEIGIFQISTSQASLLKARSSEYGSLQVSTLQSDPYEINFLQISPTQVNPGEIPLTSSISLQQFLSSHNYSLQNTTVPTWLSHLGGTTPFNLTIEVRDLPTGQLAEAQLTGFAANGTPNTGTLLHLLRRPFGYDYNGNDLGWFNALRAAARTIPPPGKTANSTKPFQKAPTALAPALPPVATTCSPPSCMRWATWQD